MEEMLEEAREEGEGEEGEGEKEIREGEGGECKGEGRATLVVERPGGPSPSQRHALSMTPRWSRLSDHPEREAQWVRAETTHMALLNPTM